MRSAIIKAFIPWLIFFAFCDGSAMGLGMASIGAIAGLILFNVQFLKRGNFFELLSFLFFVAMWVVVFEFSKTRVIHFTLPISYAFAGILCWLSVIFKKPVATEHAKYRMDKAFQKHPVFVGSTTSISLFWGCMFFLAAISTSLFNLGISNKTWMVELTPVMLIILALGFTAFYPDIYRKKLSKGKCIAALKNISPVKTATIGRIKIGYRLIGSGPLLMMICGEQMNMHHWDPLLIERLSLKFKVLIFDYPGIGYSEYKNMPYTAEAISNAIKRLFVSLQLTPYAVLGFSMGGWIAQTFAHDYPSDLKKLILINSDPGGNEAIVQNKNPQEFSTYPEAMPLFFTEETASRFAAKVKDIFDSAVLEGSITKEIIQKQHQLANAWYKEKNRAEKLSTLNIKTLILSGENDILIPPENSKILEKLIPNAEHVSYNDAGHGLIYQYPRDIADHISELIHD